MSDGTAYGGEAADTREKIMLATYAALQKHGYAGMSISRIADETDLSKSSFYHHFDGKDDILLSFADFFFEEFSSGFAVESTGDPIDDLYTFLGLIVGIVESDRDGPDPLDVLGTYLELRSQAVHDEEFRAKFTEVSDRYVDDLVPILEDGIEREVFHDVDPERTARFLLTIIEGIIVVSTTRTDDYRAELWEQLVEYVGDTVIRGELDTHGRSHFGDSPVTGEGRPSRWRLDESTDPPPWRTGGGTDDSEE